MARGPERILRSPSCRSRDVLVIIIGAGARWAGYSGLLLQPFASNWVSK